MSLHRDVTVVIPCFNYGSFVRDAVASARAQDGGAPEIVVVDDGSTDPSTVRILDELAAEVDVVRQANSGPGGARNAGAERSSTPLLLMLDADDKLAPEALTALKRPL